MFGAYLPAKPKRVLVLGSGALQIGQGGEFDYSGSQAIKALKEEGIATFLVNPNIATVQTEDDLADEVYFVAVTPDNVERIIVQEGIDGILLSFGGQTALNCGLELADRGVLDRHGVRVLGTPVESIRAGDDREIFRDRMIALGISVAESVACHNIEDARAAALKIGLPVMLRLGFTLGGQGSGIVDTEDALSAALQRSFGAGAAQVLVEKCLRGWKEIEYEIVRDGRGTKIAVCNMENFDPMGIHTGESIVVAPSQTLDDREYQLLRSVALDIVEDFGIIGECNVQFALDPLSRDYIVIEMNPRLSRSSALASKATGYPLAYVAAKLALGFSLVDLPNLVTRSTTALFEPALDYIVCKIPRWDLHKFKSASLRIGSEMKSVGEVMAIGRSFPEVLQKALRMLDVGADGLELDRIEPEAVHDILVHPTPDRPWAIARALRDGMSVDQIHELTRIDRWFLYQLRDTIDVERTLRTAPLDRDLLLRAKRHGFSDRAIGKAIGRNEAWVRQLRADWSLAPGVAQIDTLAAEFPAQTNYLYSSWHAQGTDAPPTTRKKVLILGSGSYRIGSSVEFDWCGVLAARAAAELGYETVMLNYNPETVSTDFDECDRLYFDEITLESVLDLVQLEKPDGVIVSTGGQIPNRLAMGLHRAGVPVLGTSPEDIDRAEDRSKFSALLDALGVLQPRWTHLVDLDTADQVVEAVGGFPVLVRPSYVLSGAAMSVAHEPHELGAILARALMVSPDHPVVVTKFEINAREIEYDAVAQDGEIVYGVISEHVEDAGVHSGDATVVLPPQGLNIATIRQVRRICRELAMALKITGPFNVQLLAKSNDVQVIECNLRASRSFPFVSKVTHVNLIKLATHRMLGVGRGPIPNHSLDLDYVAVKAPMFSYRRLIGADPFPGVEMASTGEVGCLGRTFHEALLHALTATGFRFPRKAVMLSLGPLEEKYRFVEHVRRLGELGLRLHATPGTAEAMQKVGIDISSHSKDPDDPNGALALIASGEVDLVINLPIGFDDQGRPDGYLIRRRAVDAGVPLLTDRHLAQAVVQALSKYPSAADLQIEPWSAFTERL
jgi:carbamoyl-phosphate synthase large subunit